MTNDQITVDLFRQLLLSLGFTEAEVRKNWKAFSHEPTGTILFVADFGANSLVRETDFITSRKHLIENGLIEKSELEGLLATGELPSPIA